MMRTSFRWRTFALSFGLLVVHCNSFLMLRTPKPDTDPWNRSAIFTQRTPSTDRYDLAQRRQSPDHQKTLAPKSIALRIFDTKSLVLDAKTIGSIASTLGFWGHSGLALLSVVLVRAVYACFFRPDNSEPKQAGILNRCPWPFIFFHDVKQGFKDSPTWIVLTWLALWRLSKMVFKQTVIP